MGVCVCLCCREGSGGSEEGRKEVCLCSLFFCRPQPHLSPCSFTHLNPFAGRSCLSCFVCTRMLFFACLFVRVGALSLPPSLALSLALSRSSRSSRSSLSLSLEALEALSLEALEALSLEALSLSLSRSSLEALSLSLSRSLSKLSLPLLWSL